MSCIAWVRAMVDSNTSRVPSVRDFTFYDRPQEGFWATLVSDRSIRAERAHMTEDGFTQRVTKVGALADPIRRALYRFVARQPGAVSRDQAAQGIEVPRHTAKFHLDKLVDEGLLTTEFRR